MGTLVHHPPRPVSYRLTALNAVEIGWPFRLGLQGRIVDRCQDLGWQRAFGDGRKIVPEVLQRRGADDDAIIAFGVEL